MSGDNVNDDGQITVRDEDGLRVLTIDRPKKLNGFTPKMLRDLAYALTSFDIDPTVRCLLICANGANFTAGLDLPKVNEAWTSGEEIYPKDALDIWDLRPPYRQKPMVIAVKGICFTVGVELMLSSDIVIAADNCRFSQLEVKRGIMASGGATIRMVERAGWNNAMRYLLTGDEWDAQTALRLNLINEVVSEGQEFDRAREIAMNIVKYGAPLSVIETRKNARTALLNGSIEAVSQFDSIREKLRNTQDFKEGVQSFVEKREPRFTGK